MNYKVSSLSGTKVRIFDSSSGVDCIEDAVQQYASYLWNVKIICVPEVVFIECFDSEDSRHNRFYICSINRNAWGPEFTIGTIIMAGTAAEDFGKAANLIRRK